MGQNLKQFKIYFTVGVTSSEIQVTEESVVVEALHDKEAVIKFSAQVPNANITELIEIL